MAKIQVTASIATKTSTGVDGGMDVDFTAYFQTDEMAERGVHQTEFSGEVTLIPHADGRPGFGSWGSIDHWLDGASVQIVNKLDDEIRSELLNEIEATCGEEAAKVQS